MANDDGCPFCLDMSEQTASMNEAFFAEVSERLPWERLQQRVRGLLEAKLGW